MRKDRRRGRRREVPGMEDKGNSLKNTLYIAGTILALGIIAFFITIMVYNNSLEKIYSDLESSEIIDIADATDNTIQTEEASIALGKTAGELENEIKETTVENEEVIETEAEAEEETTETEENIVEESNTNTTNESEEKQEEVTEEVEIVEEKEEAKELEFIYPVQGEIMKEYAKDNLVYSETLKEWITHTGIDIKADKTTVVKAAEAGTVTAIKNDPRYGTTVIIEHSGGYETVYANLLTAEFVTVGEEVKKEQTVGTVGNTAAFEILDDYHLHFELLKDGEYQDPTLYLK